MATALKIHNKTSTSQTIFIVMVWVDAELLQLLWIQEIINIRIRRLDEAEEVPKPVTIIFIIYLKHIKSELECDKLRSKYGLLVWICESCHLPWEWGFCSSCSKPRLLHLILMFKISCMNLNRNISDNSWDDLLVTRLIKESV